MRSPRSRRALAALAAVLGLSAFLAPALARAAEAPAPAPAPAPSIEGQTRLAGRPAPMRVEVRRLPVEPGLAPRPDAPRALSGYEHWPLLGLAAGAPVAEARSDERGFYAVAGLDRAAYEVRAVAESGAWGCATVVPTPGARTVVDLAVAPGPYALAGRVRRVDGTAFRGWVVVEQREVGRLATPWIDGAVAVETDAEGRFEVRGLVAGVAQPMLVVPGVVRFTLPRVAVPATAPLEVVADDGIGTREGRVLRPDGTPAALAPLVLWTRLAQGREVLAAARTDAAGRFQALGAPGRAYLHAVVPGCVAGVWGPEEGAAVEVRLQAMRGIRGVVRRADDGAPAPGAWVHAFSESNDYAAVSGPADAEGRYELEVPDAVLWRVTVGGGGWFSADPEGARWPAQAQGPALVLDLPAAPARRLRGRVADMAGAPIAGAAVTARLSDPSHSLAALLALRSLLPGATDALGRFEAEVPAGLELLVNATCPSHIAPTRWSNYFEVAAQSDAEPTVVLLRRPDLLGRVDLPAGLAPGGVRVQRSSALYRPPEAGPAAPPGERPGPGFRVTTGLPEEALDPDLDDGPWSDGQPLRADGSFRLRAGYAKAFLVTAFGWVGDAWHEGRVEVAPDAGEILVPFPEVENRQAWRVLVLAPDGTPVPQGSVTIDEAAPGSSGRRGIVLADGIFLHRAGAPGARIRWFLSDFKAADGTPLGFASVQGDWTDPGVHTVRLKEGRVLRGRVRLADGTGVEGVQVVAAPPKDDEAPLHHRSAPSGPDGAFVLLGIDEGPHTLAAQAPEGFAPVKPVLVPAGATGADLVLVRLVAARLAVRDGAGRPVAGARVVVSSPDGVGAFAAGERLPPGALRVAVGPDGTLTLPPLPPDERFVLGADSDRDDLRPWEDRAWAPADGVIVLPSADRLEGRVERADGTPAADATVWVRAVADGPGGVSPERAWRRVADGWVFAAVTGPDGRFSVGRLVPGEVEVAAALDRLGPPILTPTSAKDLRLLLP